MAQQHSGSRIFAGVFTVVGLGLVWLLVIVNLPSQQELSAKEMHVVPRTVDAPIEPTLDLSIPGVPAGATAPSDQTRQSSIGEASSPVARHDLRESQIADLRCDAEVAQLCPDSTEGPARKRCLEKRAQQLTTPCQQHLRERLVKWKEERGRMMMACRADAKRWCVSVKQGEGQILHCLQEHAQDLSDRCYETLPKGTVYFTR